MRFFPGLGLILCCGFVAGCHGGAASSQSTVETVQARVVESQQSAVPTNTPSAGTVHARQNAMISAEVAGRIQAVLVRAGDHVSAGQTLAVLDDADLRSAEAAAQAEAVAAQNQEAAAASNAKLAASTLKRYAQLESEKSVSLQEMDEVTRRSQVAEASYNAARAQAEAAAAGERQARTILGYTRLLAPFAGVVTARLADPGTLATPGVPLLQEDQAGALQLDATVDESAINAVHMGMNVPVTINSSGDAPLTGTVAEIDPAADAASHSFLVKIDLPSARQISAGMYGTAEFSSGLHQAILVPRSAVIERGSLQCAYVLDAGGIAHLRYLTLGAPQGNLVEVLSGLASGEKLIDQPLDRDLAGKRIATATDSEVQP